MKDIDYQYFKPLWLSLASLYAAGNRVNSASTFLAFQGLKQYSIEQVIAAIGSLLRHVQYLPTVADVVEAIEGRLDDKAVLAWSQVLASINRYHSTSSLRFEDKNTMWAIQTMGGWTAVCQMSPENSPKLFCQYYCTAARTCPANIPDHLKGSFELSNNNGRGGKWDDKLVINIPAVEIQPLDKNSLALGALLLEQADQANPKQLPKKGQKNRSEGIDLRKA